MERRNFIKSVAGGAAALSLLEWDSLLAALGFHEGAPYNGPLESRYVTSTCGACPGGCGIRIRTVDGIPVHIEGNPMHPVSRGGLCPVGASALSLLVHPGRIRQPLKRSGPRGSGEFTPIPWEEAGEIVVQRLSELRQSGRPEGLVFIDGRPDGPGAELAARFVADFGSPNFYRYSDPSARAAAGIWGGPGTEVAYDLENARLIFCFGLPVFEAGDNPVYFAGLRARLSARADGQRAGFVVIDPRLSASAAKAERWVPVRVGSGGLLALGLIYIIIKEGLYDQTAVSEYGVGFDDYPDDHGNMVEGFKNFVLRTYYPTYVSERTGVPLDQIIMLARSFAGTPRAAAICGNGITETVDGIYQSWAVAALNFLTGRFAKPGGLAPRARSVFHGTDRKPGDVRPLAAASPDQFPFLMGSGAVESLPERILAGSPHPIRMMMINGANPLYDSPQANRFRQAMQSVPFSVVFSSMQTETSLLADLVLPDCTFLEKDDLVAPESHFPHPVVGVMQRAVKPLYESRPANEVLLSIGRTVLGNAWLNWTDYPAYLRDSLQELFQSNSGTLFSAEFKVSYESVLAERGWRRSEYRDFEDFWEQFRAVGGWWDPLQPGDVGSGLLPTASGKFYFLSAALRDASVPSPDALRRVLRESGLEPGDGPPERLGAYRTDAEQTPNELDLYLIELTTLRSRVGPIDRLADMVGYSENVYWQSWVELNPETVKRLGLESGKPVWVESPNGRHKVPLIVNPGLVPDVAAMPAGLGRVGPTRFGANVYELLAPVRDCLTGAAARAQTKVRVYAVS